MIEGRPGQRNRLPDTAVYNHGIGRRHPNGVLQAEQHIKRQRARIAALKRCRWPRGEASSFLQLLEDAQSIHLHQLSLLLERASRERTRAGILDLAAWFSVGSLRKPYL
ncbi:hypothetical protein [Mesorhizobium sp. WSM3862]|uniref:hypothetical protein n=1 Tax=Mesorhizobium sp. WSM3862 TaxID=632858 RepID=UPI000BAFA69D|nr:hypothetical protein [Mesorhizobium sp. WSM3862]PBB97024.1 hypothetical protein CK224_16700 [Mesorhizobium sp. WSM3862]